MGRREGVPMALSQMQLIKFSLKGDRKLLEFVDAHVVCIFLIVQMGHRGVGGRGSRYPCPKCSS